MSTTTTTTTTIVFDSGNELAQAIRSVAFCCDSSSTRYALGSVCFNANQFGCQVSATDGRRLAINHTRVFELSGCNVIEFLMSAPDCKKLIKKLGKTKNSVFVELSHELVSVTFRNSKNELVKMEFKRTEGRFPNVQAIEDDCTSKNEPAIVGSADDIRNWIETIAIQFDVKCGVYKRRSNPPHGIEFKRDISLSFSPELVLPWLDVLTGNPTVTFFVKDNESPVMATVDSEKTSTFVFMPLA